jgi:hypothetical protein
MPVNEIADLRIADESQLVKILRDYSKIETNDDNCLNIVQGL